MAKKAGHIGTVEVFQSISQVSESNYCFAVGVQVQSSCWYILLHVYTCIQLLLLLTFLHKKLWNACKEGNMNRVKRALASEADVNWTRSADDPYLVSKSLKNNSETDSVTFLHPGVHSTAHQYCV